MKTMLFWASVTGWTLSIIVHLLSFFDIDAREPLPYITLLHIGMFAVFIPALSYAGKSSQFRALELAPRQKGLTPGRLFSVMAENAPYWMVVSVIVGVGYALINFAFFALHMPGSPEIRDGHYYLAAHGQWIRNITEQEYHHYSALEVRGGGAARLVSAPVHA